MFAPLCYEQAPQSRMLWHFSTFLEHNSGVRLREMQAVDSSRSNSDAFHFKNTRVTEVKKTTVEFTMMHTALRAGRALVATRNAAWKRVAWHGDGRCGDSFYLPMQEWCCTSQTTHPSFPLSLPLYTCNKNEHCCTVHSFPRQRVCSCQVWRKLASLQFFLIFHCFH